MDVTTDQTVATIQISFQTSRMTNSTELKQLRRAVETIYYLCLFTEPDYADRPEAWTSWARMGFASGLQEDPPGAAVADRVRISTFSNRKQLTFSVTPARQRVGARWVEVVRAAHEQRGELQRLPATDRAAALLRADAVCEQIGAPVDKAVAGVAEDDRETLLRARGQALAALTFPIIERCEITEATGPSTS